MRSRGGKTVAALLNLGNAADRRCRLSAFETDRSITVISRPRKRMKIEPAIAARAWTPRPKKPRALYIGFIIIYRKVRENDSSAKAGSPSQDAVRPLGLLYYPAVLFSGCCCCCFAPLAACQNPTHSAGGLPACLFFLSVVLIWPSEL